eukprot:47962_1
MGESSVTVVQVISLVCHDNPDPLTQCTTLASALGCCIENIPPGRKYRVLSALKNLKRAIQFPHASKIAGTSANFRSVPSPVKLIILSFLEFYEKAVFRGVARWAQPVATAAIHNTESASFMWIPRHAKSLFMSLVHQGLMRNLRNLSVCEMDDAGAQAILRSCPKLEYFEWLLPLRLITTRQENLKEITYITLPEDDNIDVSLADNLPKLGILRLFLHGQSQEGRIAEMLARLPSLWKVKFAGKIYSDGLIRAACAIRNITKLSLGSISIGCLDVLLDNMPQKLSHLSFRLEHTVDADMPLTTLRKLVTALKPAKTVALNQSQAPMLTHVTNMRQCQCCPEEGPSQPDQSGLLCVCLNIDDIRIVDALLQAASKDILLSVRHALLRLHNHGGRDMVLPRMSTVFPNIVTFNYLGTRDGLIHHIFGLPKLRRLQMSVSGQGESGSGQLLRNTLRFIPEITLGYNEDASFALDLFEEIGEFNQTKLSINYCASMVLCDRISRCRWPQLTSLEIQPEKIDSELVMQLVSACPSLKRLVLPYEHLLELPARVNLSGRARRVLNFRELRDFVNSIY